MMKILIPIASFDPNGGARVLSELASHWTLQGHQADFLVDERSGPPYFPTRGGIRRYNIHGDMVPGPAAENRFGARGNQLTVWRGMWNALRAVGHEYDVVIANQSMTCLPVALASMHRTRKWYYVQAYEPEYYALESGWKPRILQWLARLSYALPLQQVANAPIYVGHPVIRATEWVPPGVDFSVFKHRDTLPRLGEGAKEIVIGTVGRREPTKGTVDVLHAFEEVAKHDARLRLEVAFGNLPPGWRHPRASVVPLRNDIELAAWYRSLDVLVAAGRVQLGACHYPVIEAMVSGTPVVTTQYYPADDSCAWLVPVRNPSAIAAALQEVTRSPASAIAARTARAAQATQQFAWGEVAAKFCNLFEAERTHSRSK